MRKIPNWVRQKHWKILLASLTLLIFGGYLFARYALPPLLVVGYKYEINRAFPQFYQFDDTFRAAGIVLHPLFVNEPICMNGPFSPSTPCNKTRGAGSFSDPVNEVYQSAWPTHARELNIMFKQAGWTIEPSEGLDKLFQPPPDANTFQTFVTYSKTIKQADCEIVFENNRPGFEVTETCSREGSRNHFW